MSNDIVCGFGVRKDYEGEKNFDKTYKSIELKKKLVALGPADENGEIPYTEEFIEIVTETPIKDVIAAQNDSCGLDAYLRPYRLSGTNPPDVDVTDKIDDFTIFDGVGDLRVSGSVEKLYGSLPQDLRDKYGSPEKLLKEISDAAIKSYVEDYIAKNLVKTEKKEEKVDE